MDTNKLFKEYINPYIKARLDSLPREERNQETTESIYADAAKAFGVSVDEIRKRQEPPKRVGGSFTKALPWILGGLGAAGLGYAGMDYLNYYRKKRDESAGDADKKSGASAGDADKKSTPTQTTEAEDKTPVAVRDKQELEGIKAPPAAVELFGRNSAYGLVPKTVIRDGKIVPVVNEKGHPIMQPIVDDDGTILNGDAYRQAVSLHSETHPTREEDTGFTQESLDKRYAEGGQFPSYATGTLSEQAQDLLNVYRQHATGTDIPTKKQNWYDGLKPALTNAETASYLLLGATQKVPYVRAALRLKGLNGVGNAVAAIGPASELAMGVVGKDKHTVLRENMMRSLDPANPKAYPHTPNYIQQTSSPFDRLRFGGTDKDVISRTSNPFAQRLGSLWNIALGTAGEPFKEIAAPIVGLGNNVLDGRRASAAGDKDGTRSALLRGTGNIALTGLEGLYLRHRLSPLSLQLRLVNGLAKSIQREQNAAKVETQRIAHDAALRDKIGWVPMDIAAKRRQATNPQAVRTVGDLWQAYRSGTLPSDRIPERNRAAMEMYRGKQDTPLAQAYSRLNQLPAHVRQGHAKNFRQSSLQEDQQ